MKTHHRLKVSMSFSATALLLLAPAVQASPVTTWRTFKATPATIVFSGQGTDDPVIGSTSTTSSASRIIGYFTPQTLASVGDKISLTFKVSFNDAVGVTNSGDNFRYALFNQNGESVPVTENVVGNGSTDTNGFLGYWAGVKTGSGTDGSLRERTDTTNNDMFANASASANLVTPPIGGTNVTFAGAINGAGTPPIYTGELTLTKTATGVDLSGSFSGNGGSNTFSVSESTPIALTYGAVGFLNAAGISADQVIFQDVDVTFSSIPEAASVAMLGLVSGVSALAAVWRRRGGATATPIAH